MLKKMKVCKIVVTHTKLTPKPQLSSSFHFLHFTSPSTGQKFRDFILYSLLQQPALCFHSNLLLASAPWCLFLYPAACFNTLLLISIPCCLFLHSTAYFYTLLLVSTLYCLFWCSTACFYTLLLVSMLYCLLLHPNACFCTLLLVSTLSTAWFCLFIYSAACFYTLYCLVLVLYPTLYQESNR